MAIAKCIGLCVILAVVTACDVPNRPTPVVNNQPHKIAESTGESLPRVSRPQSVASNGCDYELGAQIDGAVKWDVASAIITNQTACKHTYAYTLWGIEKDGQRLLSVFKATVQPGQSAPLSAGLPPQACGQQWQRDVVVDDQNKLVVGSTASDMSALPYWGDQRLHGGDECPQIPPPPPPTLTCVPFKTIGALFLSGPHQQGQIATIDIGVVEGTTAEVTFASYTAPNAKPWPQNQPQSPYQWTTKTLGPGAHKLQVLIPDCFYQVDLYCGKHHPDPGNISYAELIYGAVGGTKTCNK